MLLNLLVSAGLLLTGYSCWLSPEQWPVLSTLSIAFPLFLFLTGAFIILWVFVKKRFLIIPFLTLVAAYQPTSTYLPMHNAGRGAQNRQTEGSDSVLRVVTYNTCHWGSADGYTFNEENCENLLQQVALLQPDIICLQEALLVDNDIEKRLKKYLPFLPYNASVRTVKNGVIVSILSRFPIVRKENIPIPTKGNGAAAFWISTDPAGNGCRQDIMIINCHLETMGLSLKEKEGFSSVMHSVKSGDIERQRISGEAKSIFGKLSSAAQRRAPQAETVAEFIRRYAAMSLNNGETPRIIVCGDFNDTPLSYSHHTILSALDKNNALPTVRGKQSTALVDCYREVGCGFGFTYCHNAMRVRIDHIFASGAFTPIHCWTDTDTDYSDHYPIVCDLLLN